MDANHKSLKPNSHLGVGFETVRGEMGSSVLRKVIIMHFLVCTQTR